MKKNTLTLKNTLSLLSVGALALTLTACGGSGTTTSAASSSSASASASSSATASASASTSASASAAASPSASSSATTDETKPHAHAPISATKATVPAADKGKGIHITGQLKNTGTEPITIKSAASDYAEAVEMHKTVNGVMSVDTAGWTLKPGQTMDLTEEGYHLAVKGLKASMKKGDALEITLTTTEGPAHLELTVGESTGSAHSH